MNKPMKTIPNPLNINISETDSDSRLYWKIAWRLVPLLFMCYVVAYLDRINVGFAKLQMQGELGFSDAVYGLGAGIFFVGYFLFEVPSNFFLKHFGAKKTIARIMICWGITGCLMAHVSNATEFYVLRFLLGAFEAGFFPGVVYYIGCWFPEARRGQILGIFMTGIPIAGLLGGPISGWAMSSLNGFGMHGWQWLYVVEAVPAIILGVLTIFVLDDDAANAKWLTVAERTRLSAALAPESRRNQSRPEANLRTALTSCRLYAMALAYFSFICGVYAISFWLPTVLKASGVANVSLIGWYSAIPYGVSAIGMIILCRSSDRWMERRWHTALPAIVGALAMAALSYLPSSISAAIFLLTIATTGIFATMPLFWSVATDYFSGTDSSAIAIAFINSLGLIGGFVSPSVIGWLKTMTGSLSSGLYAATAVVIGGALLLVFSSPKSIKNQNHE